MAKTPLELANQITEPQRRYYSKKYNTNDLQEKELNDLFHSYFNADWNSAMDYMPDSDRVGREVENYVKSGDISNLRNTLSNVSRFMRRY